jgi:hypothetical protein
MTAQFGLHDQAGAYDVFSRAAVTGALEVLLARS